MYDIGGSCWFIVKSEFLNELDGLSDTVNLYVKCCQKLEIVKPNAPKSFDKEFESKILKFRT